MRILILSLIIGLLSSVSALADGKVLGWPVAEGGTAAHSDDFNRTDAADVSGGSTFWNGGETDDGSDDIKILSNTLRIVKDGEDYIYVEHDLGTDYTEIWFEFTINFDEISNSTVGTWQTNRLVQFLLEGSSTKTWGIQCQVNSATPRVIAACGYRVNDSVNSLGSFSPSASTDYYIKGHVREGGAGDLMELWVDTSSTPSNKIVDDSTTAINTGQAVGKIQLGNVYPDYWIGWNTGNRTFDDWKIYTSDPGW